MSAEVETMFSVREAPWHGLGTIIKDAPTSEDAIIKAGLDWKVIQKDIYVPDGVKPIEGYKANVRDRDQKVLGVVSNRYRVVQNDEAFAFTEDLLGGGEIFYETAGSLSGGRRVWMLARIPKQYIINGDEITPYLVFTNSHDGSGSIKVAITPVRVVCQNTLNLALRNAERSWSTMHTVNIKDRMLEAGRTLGLAGAYMTELSRSFEKLHKIPMKNGKMQDFVNDLIPLKDDMSDITKKNIGSMRDGIIFRYLYAPDLETLDEDGYRAINAVSDWATHADPIRRTQNYRENLFSKTIDGLPIIDKAYRMLQAV